MIAHMSNPGVEIAEALSSRPGWAIQQILGQSQLQSEIIVSKQIDKWTKQSLLAVDGSVCKQKFHLNSIGGILEGGEISKGLILRD